MLNWTNWLKKLVSRSSSPVEQETVVQGGNKRNSVIARESDVGKELEHAEMQLEKRQRRMDEQSMVIYGQEQGSSSNSQLTCFLDWLSSNTSLRLKTRTLKEKMDRLFARQHDVLTDLEHAENQPGKKRRQEVQKWLNEVQRKKDEVRSMMKDVQGSSSNFNLSCCIDKFMEQVDELIQRAEFPNGLVLTDPESKRLPLLLGIKPVGANFQQNIREVLGWLQNHENCIIGVYGMGGVGKTTLLMQIHDQLLEDFDLYGHVYWVTVSHNCSVHKLQEDIGKAIGVVSFEEDDERKRAAILHNKLVKKGKTILILDDMWKQFLLRGQVGIPLECTSCKVILSTRLLDLCQGMGCKSFVIKAECLSTREALDLFVEKLGHYDTLEVESKQIAQGVAEECGGLPLAIATMARCMAGVVDINEWKDVLNELQSVRDHVDMKDDVFRILQYSYDRLKDKRIQNCFLSCILFGEDVKITRKELIDLWINEGLLDEIERKEDRVAKGHAILNKLESWCLLESACDGKQVKMHDLIRDMAVIITQKHPHFIAKARVWLKQVPKEEHWSNDLVKVSLSNNKIKEISSDMAPMTPKLTVLMLNGNPLDEIPDSLFVHMRALTLIDLSGTYIRRLPDSVCHLENLRTLLLCGCRQLRYVPSVAKHTKLRVLDLKYCFMLEEAPRGLERLKSVEKLSYCPWDVSDMSGFNQLVQSATFLRCFRFWIHDSRIQNQKTTLFEPIDGIDLNVNWEFEKVLQIRGGQFGKDKSSCLVPNSLEMLEIHKSDMTGRSLGDVFPSLGKATYLKEINLKQCRGLISITKLGALDSYLHLRDLVISNCPNMKVVFPFIVTVTEQVQLPNLESIKVEECKEYLHLRNLPKLKAVFSFSEQFQLHLPKLATIHVEECEEVEEVFESKKPILSLSHPIPALPNLNDIKLRNLPKIKTIFAFTCTEQLGTIRLSECEEVFDSNNGILPLPSTLRDLHVGNLPKIKVIFPSTNKEFNLSNLMHVVVEDCEEVEEIFEVNNATQSLSHPLLALPNMTWFKVRNLPKIKAVFPNAQLLHLPNLQIIHVVKCKELEEIFESRKATKYPILKLPNLWELYLQNLPRLCCVYRGILWSPFLVYPIIDEFPKLMISPPADSDDK
ncbi:hypothetical protein RDABS01_032500 [Bienertia sinuspersici]